MNDVSYVDVVTGMHHTKAVYHRGCYGCMDTQEPISMLLYSLMLLHISCQRENSS